MAGKNLIQINTPNGSVQHLSEEQLVIAGIATELAALAEDCTAVARMRPAIGSAQWVGLVAGTADEFGQLGDALHDARRSLQTFCDEHRGNIEAPTRRDLRPERRWTVSRVRIVLLSLGGGLTAAAGTVGVATAYPRLPLILGIAAALCIGLATNLPQLPPRA